MPVKTFGIFIAYPPQTDLRIHGLGRYLAGFVKGAAERDDIKIVIACPSWLRESLRQLFSSEHVLTENLEIISPDGLPISLRVYSALERWAARPRKKNLFFRILGFAQAVHSRARKTLEQRLFSTRSILKFSLLGAALFTFNMTAILCVMLLKGTKSLVAYIWHPIRRVAKSTATTVTGVQAGAGLPAKLLSRDLSVRALYRMLEQSEIDALIEIISQRSDITAWYSPASFWPNFNKIPARRLMCVPDIALVDSPVGFTLAGVGAERLTDLELAIAGSDQLVTYSDHEKWETLVKKYGTNSNSIHVVHHAASLLGQYITVTGTANDELATDTLCKQHLMNALMAKGNDFSRDIKNMNFSFLFYASQFRPNKNVISFLRAYEYLLRRRFIGLKLLLTGNPVDQPEIQQFVIDHDLQRDVLFVHNLSLAQLAACYHLARLAVNPSLSEGGFPFTFAEALSVETPIVMSRIPVTQEFVTDEELDSLMLFDAYNWRDMAARIEWALSNRTILLSKQKLLYEKVAQRTWRHVVDEHIQILNLMTS